MVRRKSMDSFFVFFYILDYCYELCPENDLGGFLGSISPELWECGKPIDMAVYNDWHKKNKNYEISKENILIKIRDFLGQYEKNFGYDFTATKQLLSKGIAPEVIESLFEKARQKGKNK